MVIGKLKAKEFKEKNLAKSIRVCTFVEDNDLLCEGDDLADYVLKQKIMRALKNLSLDNVLFISINTVPVETEFPMEGLLHNSWFETAGESDYYEEKASLSLEYGKIFCVSLGYVKDHQLNIKTIQGEEEEIIKELFRIVDAFQNNWSNVYLCGHSIKSFILPYITCVEQLSTIFLFNTYSMLRV